MTRIINYIAALFISMAMVSCYSDTYLGPGDEEHEVPEDAKTREVVDTMLVNFSMQQISALPVTQDSITLNAENYAFAGHHLRIMRNGSLIVENMKDGWEIISLASDCSWVSAIEQANSATNYNIWFGEDVELSQVIITLTHRYYIRDVDSSDGTTDGQ